GRDEIRIQSAAVLRDIGDPRAVEPLIEALKNEPRKEIKATAAQALGNMKAHGVNNGTIAPLTQALTLDDTTATNAATALGQIKISSEPTIQKLIAIALDKRGRETVRSAALFALSQLAPVQAVQPMMLLMLSDETSAIIRKGAVTVLGEIQAKETVPALLWVLATRYEDIKDFQRHTKREYRTIAGLSAAIDGLKIQWTPEYPKPDYRTWSELKPIPSLVRGEAAISLGKIKESEVVEPLIQALENDERAAVRRSAAWALGEIKGDAVIPPLERALKKDEQGIVRREAAIALDKIKGDKVVEPLLTALKKDKYETTRKQAAIALRELNPKLADDGLVDVLKKGVGAFEEGKEAQSVLDEVMGALIKDSNATTAKFLLDALKSTDDELVRWSIVYTLGAIKDSSAVNAIAAELTHSSDIVRKEAVTTVGGYQDRKVVDALIKVLQDGNESKAIRANAAASLGTLRDERASAPLRAALDDENAEIRLQAVAALGAIKDAAAVDKLIGLLQNPLEDEAVRAACVTALASIGDKKVNAVLLNILRTETLFEDIDHNAITALGTLKSVEAVPELIRILEERGAEANARTRAATALAAIGDPRAAEAIGRRLVDDSEYVVAIDGDGFKRNYTWEAFVTASRLFQQLPSFVAPKMIERIESTWEDRPIKAAATIALGLCNSPQAPSVLRKQLASPTVAIRQAAALSIGEGKVRELKDDLVKIMKGETEKNHDVRRSATQGLGELADASTVPALIEVLKDDSVHEEIRRDAAIALGKIGGDAAVSALVEKLGTLQASKTAKDLRLDIIEALAEAKNQKAVPVLKTVLDDENADLHFQAADALFQITGDGYGYHRAG
ncbi:HEAT repeat domain-containing protein, partial [Candidatus Poribacteria bacterium]|nr:HEAT repeat domain-containing protein [Candidatus Poribacteria bacterium]